MAESDADQPSDTMRERVGESRTKLWLLLDADRRVIATIPLGLVFISLVVLGVLDPAPISRALVSGDPLETVFQGFLTAIITGVTLVVTINQLVLSQELGAVDDQRERMAGAMDFREDVETAIEAPISPPEPSSFLRAIIDVTQTRANALEEAVSESRDEQFKERTEDYVDSLTVNAETVGNQLEDAQFGTFDLLFAALDYNYSWKIYEARRLRNEHEDAVTDETDDAFESLIEVLKFFGPAREHFKTLYFEWELINLSRAMLYSAVPALVVVLSMMLYVANPGSITGTTFGVENLVWVASAASTIALIPFMLLLSFILRIATVAKRTLSIGPFILRESARTEDIAWDE
ncbi:hypothetical protein [Halococcus saccharolyticus]|uniref:Uncharacterized protein n=1 Tax=Halococcus saccharolyticus DSM 5350 TaxID=1227455 RepID=M0MI20_9EURY|nr:hypothetical protein [Halococcus saccharolyticus]EMA44060.1 hypothetical protein C449_11058 [Halococcus saccharolyticus DSM 5350]